MRFSPALDESPREPLLTPGECYTAAFCWGVGDAMAGPSQVLAEPRDPLRVRAAG
jgi:hypothetical protein